MKFSNALVTLAALLAPALAAPSASVQQAGVENVENVENVESDCRPSLCTYHPTTCTISTIFPLPSASVAA
ncbi:hypothetical protein V8C37DRAFT_363742 [Trichoderma ceciliae]